MQRLFLAAAVTLLAAPAITAQGQKSGPADELKKQIADLKAVMTKKKVELTKALHQAEVIGGAHRAVKEAGEARLKELDLAEVKALVAPREKAAAAMKDAEKATEAEVDAARTLDAARAKLKNATEPQETEELKKTVADLEVALKEKVAGAEKARTVARNAEYAYTSAKADARVRLMGVMRVLDTAIQNTAFEAAKANALVAQITDERDATQIKIQKLKQQLEELGK
jgi:hypothetical protein